MEKAADFFGQDTDDDEYEEFRNFGKGFSDPDLIADMDKACELITSAIDNGELICVYGGNPPDERSSLAIT